MRWCEKCQNKMVFTREFNVVGAYPVSLCRKCYDTLENLLQSTPEFKEYESLDQELRAKRLAYSRSSNDYLVLIRAFDAVQRKLWLMTKKFLDD